MNVFGLRLKACWRFDFVFKCLTVVHLSPQWLCYRFIMSIKYISV